MRIDNSGSREVDQTGKAVDRSGMMSPTRTQITLEVSTHTASPELKSLRDAVQLLPATRPGLVADTVRRLGLGDLSSKETLSRTADALTATSAENSPALTSSELALASLSPSDLSAPLGQLPLIREDRVAQVTSRLQAGTLSTPEAIQDTAATLSN